MIRNLKSLAPALFALGVFMFSPANAGDGKNGEIEVDKNAPDTMQTGGDGESAKNDPQPPSDGKNDPQPPPPPPPPPPDKPRGGPGGHNGGHYGTGNGHGNDYSGGGSNDYGVGNITCVINGRVFRVRSVRECYVQPKYGNYQANYYSHRKSRHVMISGGVQGEYGGGYNDGGGYAYGGGYGYEQQPIIRYYKPASRAAMMQAEKRARRAARYGMQGGGYGYGGAYAGGYGMQGGYGYGMQGGYMKKHRKHRRGYAAPIYMPAPSYDPGYVVHYGPTISKDGGY